MVWNSKSSQSWRGLFVEMRYLATAFRANSLPVGFGRPEARVTCPWGGGLDFVFACIQELWVVEERTPAAGLLMSWTDPIPELLWEVELE